MRVLVVDDDPSVRGVVRVSLDEHDVVEADSGDSALAELRSQRFDAVLLDVAMPGIGGLETLKLLRADASCGDPAVLMLTGRVGEADRAAAFRLGADGYLTKPMEPADLSKAVDEAVGRAPGEREAVRLEELGRAEFLHRLERGYEL